MIAIMALLLFAGDSGSLASADPMDWIADDFSVLIDVRNPGAAISRVIAERAFQSLIGLGPGLESRIQEGLALLPSGRTIVALRGKGLRSTLEFIAVLERGQGEVFREIMKLTKISTDVHAATFEGRDILASSARLLESVSRSARGEEKRLRDREGLHTSPPQSHRVAYVWADVKRLIPFRPGLKNPEDTFQALLLAHVLHALRSAKSAEFSLDVEEEIRVELTALTDEIPKTFEFAVPKATLPMLEPPPGTMARLSIPRLLGQFWLHRNQLVPEKERPGLGEFETGLGIVLGGASADDVLAKLGPELDLFLAQPAEDSKETPYPRLALVAHLSDPKLKDEFLLGFQEVIALSNIQAAEERRARWFLESSKVADTTIVWARYLDGHLPEVSDPRRTLRPALAVHGNRLILGTDQEQVRSLVTMAAEPSLIPRDFGDELVLRGGECGVALLAARRLVVPLFVLNYGGDLDVWDRRLDLVAEFLAATKEVRVGLEVRSDHAKFGVSWRSASSEGSVKEAGR